MAGSGALGPLPDLQFTAHARRRMTERVIGEADVQRAVRDHQIRVVRADGKVDYLAHVEDFYLKVVIDERDNPWTVITVYDLSAG
jgi:hypothetical protein